MCLRGDVTLLSARRWKILHAFELNVKKKQNILLHCEEHVFISFCSYFAECITCKVQ